MFTDVSNEPGHILRNVGALTPDTTAPCVTIKQCSFFLLYVVKRRLLKGAAEISHHEHDAG